MNMFNVGDHISRGELTAVITDSDHYKYFLRYGDGSSGGHDKSWIDDNYTLVQRAAENSAVSPNVYKFPKAEVRDISAHLTSYGGQILQYVARSTRLDGIFKDDRVQDLEKAKLMIQWEIDRLQEAK